MFITALTPMGLGTCASSPEPFSATRSPRKEAPRRSPGRHNRPAAANAVTGRQVERRAVGGGSIRAKPTPRSANADRINHIRAKLGPGRIKLDRLTDPVVDVVAVKRGQGVGIGPIEDQLHRLILELDNRLDGAVAKFVAFDSSNPEDTSFASQSFGFEVAARKEFIDRGHIGAPLRVVQFKIQFRDLICVAAPPSCSGTLRSSLARILDAEFTRSSWLFSLRLVQCLSWPGFPRSRRGLRAARRAPRERSPV